MINKKTKFKSNMVKAINFKKIKRNEVLFLSDDKYKNLNLLSGQPLKDGVLLINKNIAGWEIVHDLFCILIQESASNLKADLTELNGKYPNINDVTDIFSANYKEDDMKLALCKLLIPIELQRREIVKKYYD